MKYTPRKQDDRLPPWPNKSRPRSGYVRGNVARTSRYEPNHTKHWRDPIPRTRNSVKARHPFLYSAGARCS